MLVMLYTQFNQIKFPQLLRDFPLMGSFQSARPSQQLAPESSLFLFKSTTKAYPFRSLIAHLKIHIMVFE